MAVHLKESEPFKSITKKLIDWNMSKISGGSVYRKAEKYAHIEISVYKSPENESAIIWGEVDSVVPDEYLEFKPHIENVLLQFEEYLRDIKNEELNLIFEILDISYHPVDYRIIAYEIVTCKALLNCFDKEKYKFETHKIFRIK